ncbi:aldehyde dehydrogenase family protein [Plantibacter flavus]|uniref:aldehyde dehydrogenase family protein n=1 Tax=Plantibacter flavus TaxID=150123 RepID=UPI0023788961|nr:aldehyde dehydrogenase family protein [Plantibacter flavus]MDD9152448.1 aldehyde dehydrogenase family protein [Plantibacter flavus]
MATSIRTKQEPKVVVADTVVRLRQTFDRGTTKPVAWRLRQLRALKQLLLERGGELERALATDLGKSGTEAQITEIGLLVGEIDHTLKHLKRWVRPRRVAVPLTLAPASASVVAEPVGVVLVIGPWNYPVQLCIGPVIGALAAGDAVLLKPSELAPATSAALARLLPEYLDDRAVAVVEGDAEVATALLAERFDHIFYTGGAAVGKVVARAAAEHLTPITLELGGKSPVYVDDTVDLADAARRIVWGKLMNAGQTCVAPDYLLATRSVADRLVPYLRDAIAALYGPDPADSADYGRIISDKHFARVSGLLDGLEPALGGGVDASERYIAPTVVNGVDATASIMQEEIFGPILPILHVSGLEQAIAHIRAGEKPLALYVFSDDRATRKRFTRDTSSGSLAFGVPAAHLLVPGLPFGGVGASGMGAYHGRHSFDTFSHAKAVFSKPLSPDTLSLVYPPFTEARDRIARLISRAGSSGDRRPWGVRR